MGKDICTVTVYDNWVKVADTLNTDQRGEFYTAIMHYALYGKVPKLSSPLDAFFALILPNIDKSNSRKQAGSNGGSKKQANRIANGVANGKQNDSKLGSKTISKTGSEEEVEVEEEVEEDDDNTAPGGANNPPKGDDDSGKLPLGARYPETVDEVLEIAGDVRCGEICTRKQAEEYFLARDTVNWVDGNRRSIAPNKVYGDLKRWLLRVKSQPPKREERWQQETGTLIKKLQPGRNERGL